jgi:hypothetical protein
LAFFFASLPFFERLPLSSGWLPFDLSTPPRPSAPRDCVSYGACVPAFELLAPSSVLVLVLRAMGLSSK